MQLEEILNAIEALDPTDLVPVLEVVTAKLAWQFWYLDSYAESDVEVPAEAISEDVVEEIVEDTPAEELVDERLSL